MTDWSYLGEDEKLINRKISLAMGCSVYDLYASKEAELQDFRKNIIKVVRESVRQRQQCGAASVANYHYPPELEASTTLPPAVEKRLNHGYLNVCVRRNFCPITLRVTWDVYPERVIGKALKRLSQSHNSPGLSHSPSSYVLKVLGTKEYLLAARPITQYKTVRFLLCHGKTPELCLVSRRDLYSTLSTVKFEEPAYAHQNSSNEEGAGMPPITLWHPSLEGRLRVHVLDATDVACKEAQRVFVCAGVFHGEVELCTVRETQRLPCPKVEWGEWLHFELPIQEIPRGAKLCLAVWCERLVTDRMRMREKMEEMMVAWGNVNLFDYRGQLVHGKVSVPLHFPISGFEERLNPLGPTGQKGGEAALEVEFEKRFGQNVTFPDTSQMEDYARYINKLEKGQQEGYKVSSSAAKAAETANSDHTSSSSTTIATITRLAEKDPLDKLSPREREALWQGRHMCLEVPDSLPRLLEALRWSSRDQVSQLYLLLKEWPTMALEMALSLLQGKSADPTVRHHAVRLLDQCLTDETFLKYLLQLVQSLRHEHYFFSPLVCFLLRRGLTNARLGHFLFWHLKAEVDHWPCPLYIKAILEAYCRGLCPGGLQALVRQVEAVAKLTQLADLVKEKADASKNTMYLRDLLRDTEYSTALQHLPSPLHPAHSFGRLRESECRVLDSARRPLWLAWQSSDPLSCHPTSLSHSIIFKRGDDLRQDMVCLQVIGIMAELWTREGLDLCVLPYTCLATGRGAGMIEVVPNAETVYNIQSGSMLDAIQVKSSQLLKWIRDKNKDVRLEQAIKNFTRSCAGYCVATFVLGIGDRHPSNIMVNEEGMIFHIDFGHILGNFKKKAGIQRERVPFVLPPDFLFVIANGAENPKESHEFQRFQELCGKAYLTLRRHYRLLVTLFSQLVNTGMPHLQTQEDVSYLRETLAMEVGEEEALQFFQNRFHEAYGGAWTTKIDWFFHWIKHR